MVNKPIIRRLLNNLEGYVNDLKRADDITLDKFMSDVRTQRFVERTLHISIECCFDIAHHIISDQGFREPTSYADAFVVLGENDILPIEYAKECRLIWQLRNKIVQYYDKIEPAQTFDFFKNHLAAFDVFRCRIMEWLEKT